MGRRLILGVSLVMIAGGCGSQDDKSAPPPPANKLPGVEAHPDRGQINPNAQMPSAGTKSK